MVLGHFEEGAEGCIVETGSNLGVTTALLAQSLRDAGVRNPRVFTFEINKKNLTRAKAFWLRAEVDELRDEIPSAAGINSEVCFVSSPIAKEPKVSLGRYFAN